MKKIIFILLLLVVSTASGCKSGNEPKEENHSLVGEWDAHDLLYTDTIDENGYSISIEKEGSVGEYIGKVVITDETIAIPDFSRYNYKYEVYGDSITMFVHIVGSDDLYFLCKGKFIFYGKDTLRMPNIWPSLISPIVFRTVMLIRIKE